MTAFAVLSAVIVSSGTLFLTRTTMNSDIFTLNLEATLIQFKLERDKQM